MEETGEENQNVKMHRRSVRGATFKAEKRRGKRSLLEKKLLNDYTFLRNVEHN